VKPTKPSTSPTSVYKRVKVGLVSTGRAAWDTRGPQMEPECWHPNYPGDEVEVGLITYNDPPGLWKVLVWGADDTGVEIYVKSLSEAEWLYNAIGDGVTRDALHEFGFQPG
jgi:hypothetical protein